jgi:ArsR family metal-binding transcriptional regulator
MTDRLMCQSCNKSKAQLQRVSSKLIPGMELNMCRSCITAKYEPRYIIILASNMGGVSALVTEFINKKRYEGREILAIELLAR